MNHQPTAAMPKLGSEVSSGPVFFFFFACAMQAQMKPDFVKSCYSNFGSSVECLFCPQTFSLAFASTI